MHLQESEHPLCSTPSTVKGSCDDCLIAACALGHDLAALHVDRDFTNLSKVSQLEARDLNRR